MNSRAFTLRRAAPGARRLIAALVAALCLPGANLAAAADPGRLFFTPAERAALEAARARDLNRTGTRNRVPADESPAPLRYDGVVIRSDGKTLRWVDGKPQPDASAVPGLKPGQVRAYGKVYEPYQVRVPDPAASPKDDTP